MKAASLPVQRPAQAKLLVVDNHGNIRHWARSKFAELLRPGDLIVANDAATLPASLSGQHLPTGRPIEVRLAGRRALALDAVREFSAVVFGAGDFRTRTEDRPLPPLRAAGDRLALGPLRAIVTELLNHPRLVRLEFDGSPEEIWEGLARHGHPIQYSYVAKPLALWDVWTPISGLSALAISKARARGGRIIAIGTTVVRALEDAAEFDGSVRVGEGLATHRIGTNGRLHVVNAILSGTHEPGTSHYDLLRAFIDDTTLRRMDHELDARGYRTHKFGDSVYIERKADANTQEHAYRITWRVHRGECLFEYATAV